MKYNNWTHWPWFCIFYFSTWCPPWHWCHHHRDHWHLSPPGRVVWHCLRLSPDNARVTVLSPARVVGTHTHTDCQDNQNVAVNSDSW